MHDPKISMNFCILAALKNLNLAIEIKGMLN